MAFDAVLIEVSPGEARAAFLRRGILERLVVDRGDEDHREGDLFLGRVTRVVPAIEAAFVDLGLAAAGFLAVADARPAGVATGSIRAWVREGQSVLVQVLRQAEAGKGPKLTLRPRLSGRYLALLPAVPGGGQELVALAAAADAPAEAIEADGDSLRQAWAEIGEIARAASPPAMIRRSPGRVLAAILEAATPAPAEIRVNDATMAATLRAALPELAGRIHCAAAGAPLFAAAGVDEAIEVLLSRAVRLPSGGAITIEETAAGIAIDVDSGAAASGDAETVAASINLEAAAEISRQVRLRDLGGYLLVDFLPLRRRRNRDRLLEELRRAFADDAEETRIGGFTRLGRVEISRRRRRPSLPRRLTTACPLCALGRVKSPLTVAFEALRWVVAEDRAVPGRTWRITAPPAVIAALRGDGAAARTATETRLGRPLDLVEDERIALDRFAVEAVAPTEKRDGE
jgi:ribonuclease G